MSSSVMSGISFIFGVVVMFGLPIWGFYLSLLLYRFLKASLRKEEEKKIKVVHISSGETVFFQDETEGLSINAACVQILYVKDHTVFAELIGGDVYPVRQCQDEEEARAYLVQLSGQLGI